MPPTNKITRARRAALQAIYQWQLNRQPSDVLLSEFVADRELINVAMPHFERLTHGIPEDYDDLTKALAPYLNLEWNKVGEVERAVLLIGAFELLHCEDIPERVILNEAIELVKMFGAEESYRFINGVLDQLAKAARGSGTIGADES